MTDRLGHGCAPRFLGLCTGRCGSRYLVELLNDAGVPTLHEKNTDSLHLWNEPEAMGEINGHFVTQMDPWPEARIWHFNRHPQAFVASLIKFGFWDMDAPAIHPYLRRTGDQLGDSYRYWIDWNRRILEIPEPRRTTFRIEDISRELIVHLADTIGVEAESESALPRIRWIEAQEFAEIPVDVESELYELMDLLGYEYDANRYGPVTYHRTEPELPTATLEAEDTVSEEPAKLKLNLGCCDAHMEGFCNVDRVPPADVITDLEKDWPWLEDTVDEIVANDVFEHLPDKIHTMNEAWRVLKPGGILSIVVPTTDGRGAFQDPTHCSFWTPHDLLYYTAGSPERERFGNAYGISARFAVVACQHREITNKVWVLAAILEALE
jgi:hypothetical protein